MKEKPTKSELHEAILNYLFCDSRQVAEIEFELSFKWDVTTGRVRSALATLERASKVMRSSLGCRAVWWELSDVEESHRSEQEGE